MKLTDTDRSHIKQCVTNTLNGLWLHEQETITSDPWLSYQTSMILDKGPGLTLCHRGYPKQLFTISRLPTSDSDWADIMEVTREAVDEWLASDDACKGERRPTYDY